ncbi:MAG: hypothetical protein AAGK74_00080 [Chloroflexota bacterium]
MATQVEKKTVYFTPEQWEFILNQAIDEGITKRNGSPDQSAFIRYVFEKMYPGFPVMEDNRGDYEQIRKWREERKQNSRRLLGGDVKDKE